MRGPSRRTPFRPTPHATDTLPLTRWLSVRSRSPYNPVSPYKENYGPGANSILLKKSATPAPPPPSGSRSFGTPLAANISASVQQQQQQMHTHQWGQQAHPRQMSTEEMLQHEISDLRDQVLVHSALHFVFSRVVRGLRVDSPLPSPVRCTR